MHLRFSGPSIFCITPADRAPSSLTAYYRYNVNQLMTAAAFRL